MTSKREAARVCNAARGVLLDLGAGANKTQGAVGVDHRPLPGIDIVCDLFKPPWPIPTSCAHTVVLSHVCEHVPPWLFLDFMAELHRVCRDGAGVLISSPFSIGPRWQQDPTHCRPITEATFMYFDPDHPSQLWKVYEPPPFRLQHCEIIPAGYDRDINIVLVCQKLASPPLRRKRRS